MIAVLGSTGTIGRHVAAGLAERDAAVRLLCRGRAGSVDLRDPASLGTAIDGADQLFLLTPHGPDQDLLEANALRRRGASAFEVDHAIRMAAYFASGADGAPTDAVRRLTGRMPRTVQQFLTEKGT